MSAEKPEAATDAGDLHITNLHEAAVRGLFKSDEPKVNAAAQFIADQAATIAALRREVEERQKAMILKTAEIGLLRAILADTEPVAKFEFAADGNYLKLKWRPNYVCKDGDKLYLHPYGMKERAEAAERELAATIAALRTDLAYYQAKWEHELSTVSKLERERDALREEVSRLTENQRQQDSATAFVMERDEKERDALRKEVEEYKSEYFRVHNLKMDAIEARLAAERELAACREDAERWNRIHDLVCVHDGVFRLYTLDESKFALDSNLIHGGARLKAAIDAAIKAARKV